MADNSGHRPFYKYTHTNAIYRHDISIKKTNTISSSDSKRTIKKCDCQLNYTDYVSISSSYHAHVKGNKKNSKTKNCVIIYHRPNCKQNITFISHPKDFKACRRLEFFLWNYDEFFKYRSLLWDPYNTINDKCIKNIKQTKYYEKRIWKSGNLSYS